MNPTLRRWLDAEAASPEQAAYDPAWDRWLLGMCTPRRCVGVGEVLVDRRLLAQRYACVPERCAPGPDRGSWRSCCADVGVELSLAEARRLARRAPALRAALQRGEPRLRPLLERRARWWLDASGCLSRPGGRCVFSAVDRRGALRCRLRRLANARRWPRLTLQPMACALFPLVVVPTSATGCLLTLVGEHTYRLLGHLPPRRYPCLADPSLPPLVESLASELDLLFGRAFARRLRALAEE